MDEAEVADALDEIHDLLAGDGLRFELVAIDQPLERLRLRLDLSQVECADCVLPADMLAEVVTDSLRQRLIPTVTVAIEDPRVLGDLT